MGVFQIFRNIQIVPSSAKDHLFMSSESLLVNFSALLMTRENIIKPVLGGYCQGI